MAEDWAEKTQDPTPRRRQEAREAGQVARSGDLAAAVVVLGMLVIFRATAGTLVRALQAMLRDWLGGASFFENDPAAVASRATHALGPAVTALAPLLLGAVMLGAAANVAQFGWVFAPRRLRPDFQAINPARGLGRIFNPCAPSRLALGVLKLLVAVAVAWSAMRPRLAEITALQTLAGAQLLALSASIVYAVAVRLALAMFLLGLVDFAHRRWVHDRELRMTRREVHEEMRRMDGDPKLKQRRQQIARQWAVQRQEKSA